MRCATFIPSSGQRVTRRTLRRTGTGEAVGAVPLTFDLQQSGFSAPDGDGEHCASSASTAEQYSVLNARIASAEMNGAQSCPSPSVECSSALLTRVRSRSTREALQQLFRRS